MPNSATQQSLFAEPVTHRDVERQHDKRKANRERLRAALADGRHHSTNELIRLAGARFGARLQEIREGEPLTVHRVWSGGQWYYRADPSGDLLPGCHGPCCLPWRESQERLAAKVRP